MSLSDQLFTPQEWAELQRTLQLSTRHVQILQLLARGLSDKEISSTLKISLGTLRTHLDRMGSQLKAPGRQHLLICLFKAFRNGCPLERCPRNC